MTVISSRTRGNYSPHTLCHAPSCAKRRRGRIHAALHTLVVELSGSKTLALLADITAEITTARAQAVWKHANDDAQKRADAELAHCVHRKLFRLVEDGKAADAELLGRRHMKETTEKMQRTRGIESCST